MKKFIVAILVLCSLALCGEEAYSSAIKVEKVLCTDTTSAGQTLHFPDSLAAVTGIVVTIPVGGQTGWHTHGFSGFAYIIEGVLTVEMEQGNCEYTPGSSFAEVVSLAHNGKNNGTVPVKLVAFFSGKNGEPISSKIQK